MTLLLENGRIFLNIMAAGGFYFKPSGFFVCLFLFCNHSNYKYRSDKSDVSGNNPKAMAALKP